MTDTPDQNGVYVDVAEDRDLSLPPHSLDAERAVLGAVLMMPESLTEIGAILEPRDFYEQAHRHVFGAMLELALAGVPPDVATVSDHLRRGGVYEPAGGVLYLAELLTATATAAHIKHYARIVERTSIMRQLIDRAQTIAEIAFRDNLDPATVLAKAEHLIGSVAPPRFAGGGLPFRTARELVATTPPNPRVVIPYLCFAGLASELVGKVKASGKTTLLLHGIAALLGGREFLGQRVERAPVVLLTEQPDASLRIQLAAAGLTDSDDLHILSHHLVYGQEWVDVAGAAAERADSLGAGAFGIDTFGQFTNASDDAENNSAAAKRNLDPLLKYLRPDGWGLLLNRHEGHADRPIGDAGRGSTAIAGALDVLVRLRRMKTSQRPTLRELELVGRIPSLPSKLIIELTADRGYVLVGSTEQVALEEAKRVLVEAAPETEADAVKRAKLLDSIAEDVRPSGGTVTRALTELVRAGRLRRSGKGVSGDPYLYARGKPGSEIHSMPRTPWNESPEDSDHDDPAPQD